MKITIPTFTAALFISAGFAQISNVAEECELVCDNLSVATEDATALINEIKDWQENGTSCCNGNRTGSQCTTFLSAGSADGIICGLKEFTCVRGVDSPTGGEILNGKACASVGEILNKIQQGCLQDGYTGGKCNLQSGGHVALA